MRRTLSVAAIILTALMSYGLYNMKYEVRRLEDKLTTLNKTLVTERQAVQVLRAEWAYLHRPARLDKLSNRHLDLKPVVSSQLTDLDDVPERAVERPQKAALMLPKMKRRSQ